jgi:hypothetical protein
MGAMTTRFCKAKEGVNSKRCSIKDAKESPCREIASGSFWFSGTAVGRGHSILVILLPINVKELEPISVKFFVDFRDYFGRLSITPEILIRKSAQKYSKID